MEHAYVTYDNGYIESVWWIIKQLWDTASSTRTTARLPTARAAGPRSRTHEVALGYKDDTPDPSVYVKFRVTEP